MNDDISTVWIDTYTEEIEYNDVLMPLDVTHALAAVDFQYTPNLAKTLAPFVSPTFRLVVNGIDYEPIEVNERGGKQSTIKGRFDLLPALAIEDIAVVLQHGAIKYGDDNWRTIPSKDHVNHALRHCFSWLITQELGELTHAATRLLMAIEVTYDRS